MDWWVVGLVANAVVAVAYFAICAAIVVPLVRSQQLRSNPLGGATAAIFFTCAVHHGTHSVHMLMPVFGVDEVQGIAMRTAWGWQLALWDVVGALVGVYYWTLRRNYGSLMEGAQLFEDMRKREEQALELNDNVLQGLVVAKMSLDLGDQRRASEALETAISSASHMITDLLGPDRRGSSERLLRGTPAVTAPPPEKTPDDRDGDTP
ncbi:hypothetical protein G7072_12655 [Nocardioides sp. HDW12B]|uniref:hypothetical protein n=1 Tax=Nocardioides sp. HDW12B TaxID=2714939 RepID=UPI00140C6F0F|nr:hypothetical protein [Nocardioides sp. HDW12B]QIK67079.1 hypothetical protein G7072_12655 [Nocardioides sp. HDW12B]